MNLNIICLHGFTQNNEIFQKKLSKLIKSNDKINLYFLEGSALLTPDGLSKAYWTHNTENPLDVSADPYDVNTKMYSLEKSLDAFLALGKQLGRVDGIIGFSQGGCFTDYICNLYADGKIPYDIRFAVFIAARPFSHRTNKIKTIKTLHMYGENDIIVQPPLSIELSECYENHTNFSHPGQHIVPSTSSAKTTLKNFLSQFLTN